MAFQKGHQTNRKSVPVTSPDAFTTTETSQPINYYNKDGYLPQHADAYTTLSVVRIGDNQWVLRQVDIINGKIASIQDSKPNARAVIFEYYKVAAADLFYKEHYSGL